MTSPNIPNPYHTPKQKENPVILKALKYWECVQKTVNCNKSVMVQSSALTHSQWSTINETIALCL